jgi:putative transposase
MARLPRFTLPGYPHHVIQRGNNRQTIFASAENHQVLLDLMAESAKRFEVDVHAYVLMDNHFHLLLTPRTQNGLPLMMQAVGRRYVRYFNDLQGRTGTLWEGRYRSTVIEAERFLLACMTYIDLNPVRAGVVAQAGDYPWSSYGHYTGQRIDKLITPHPLLWELGNTPFAREAAYADMVQAGLNMVQQTALTDCALNGWALGSSEFVGDLQKKTLRRLSKSTPGRPTSISNKIKR